MGATDVIGRLVTSIYQHQALTPTFFPCHDVACGGVLLALPALLAVGLLSGIEKYFQLPRGFYRLDTIFLLLAFMALAWLKVMETLRYCAPDEWGKLLGMDRIPEVKTMRDKVDILSQEGMPREWMGELSQSWMEMSPEAAGVLYVDGHVRVYHGKQTQLPRHYVSRQKLCLQATVDYWVNAADGQPFFVVNKAVDPGLQQVLEDEIIPRLEHDLPPVPRQLTLEQSPWRHRFTMVFDREGYSPALLERLRDRHIACLSYRKFTDDDWPEAEFRTYKVTLANGNVVDMLLAERGVRFGQTFWLREVRKLTAGKHQTAILSTDYTNELHRIAPWMFARWSQENFFGYMRQHFNLDRLK
jgi:prepilin-type processing-associated H-X9-DG protein